MTAACITGWSVISCIGIGRKPFADSYTHGHRGLRPVAGLPLERAGVVADFDATALLGTRNTRSLDRLTALTVATAGMVLDETGTVPAAEAEPVAVVVGTTSGSVSSISDFTRESLVQPKPFYVNPALFPNTVMNCAAGQTAIRYGLTGANTTVSGGHLTGFLAMRYATRTMARGYSHTVLAGAVEEFCAHRAWADVHLRSRARRRQRPIGEGCAMFQLDRPEVAARTGRTVLARLLGFAFGVCAPPAHPHAEPDSVTGPSDGRRAGTGGPDRRAEALRRCVRRVLAQAGTDPDELWAVSLAQVADPAGDAAEAQAVLDALGPAARRRVPPVADLIGDTYSAAGAFQLAGVLAQAAEDRDSSGRPALMTAVAPDGAVGCVLVGT